MELLCVLYAYKYTTTNNDGHESLGELISLFRQRMLLHKDYFQTHHQLRGYHEFVSTILEYMFPDEYASVSATPKQTKRSIGEIIRAAIKEIFS